MLPSLAVDKAYPLTGRYGGFTSDGARGNALLLAQQQHHQQLADQAMGREGGEALVGLTLGSNSNLPKPRKTGTTIVGIVFKGGVVLGADTRATGDVVVDKNCGELVALLLLLSLTTSTLLALPPPPHTNTNTNTLMNMKTQPNSTTLLPTSTALARARRRIASKPRR